MTALGRTALLAATLALAADSAAAQEGGCASLLRAGAAADSARPTVLVRATADVRELRFETQPRTEVRTTGCLGLDSIVTTERVNLPDPVEPGVTYRDVRVGIEIRANLDVACLPALAADPAFADLCGPGAPASAAPPPSSRQQQQPSRQQPSQQQTSQQQQPNAPAPANPSRR